MGVLDGFLYAVITRTIYKYLGGGNWGSAVKTLTGNPTQVTNFSIGETEYLIVAHTEGVSYTSDGSTWVDITTNRDTVGDFDLSGGASHPTGMFFANSKLYVGDSDDDKIYGFAVNGDRNAGDDINSLPTSDLQGIASSGTRIYLLDGAAQNVKVINFSGVREQDLDFDLAPLNTDPKGIAVKADGTTILVLDGRSAQGVRVSASDGGGQGDRAGLCSYHTR